MHILTEHALSCWWNCNYWQKKSGCANNAEKSSLIISIHIFALALLKLIITVTHPGRQKAWIHFLTMCIQNCIHSFSLLTEEGILRLRIWPCQFILRYVNQTHTPHSKGQVGPQRVGGCKFYLPLSGTIMLFYKKSISQQFDCYGMQIHHPIWPFGLHWLNRPESSLCHRARNAASFIYMREQTNGQEQKFAQQLGLNVSYCRMNEISNLLITKQV